MAGVRPEVPAGLRSINGVDGIEHAQEPRHIFLVSRGNDVEIERIHGRAVQRRRYAANNDKSHASLAQRAQCPQKITVRH
jgi:hypothetical protein